MSLGHVINHDQSSLELISSLSFCVIDLETTGGNHQYDKIIEIGLIKIENLKIVGELSFLVNPEIPIPEFIQKLTSISPEQLKGCPLIENIIDDILAFMGDSILVAHNSSFDIPFFNSVLHRLRRNKVLNRTLCTNLMTKNLIPEIVNSNLSYMSKIFDIGHSRAHRALEDAKATAQLLIYYLNFFIEKNIKKINQLYYPRKKFELDCFHFKTPAIIENIINKLLTISCPLLITIKGEKGIILNILPIKSTHKQIEFIKENIEQTPWKTITIKLAGSFVQTLFGLNNNFSKLPKQNQKEIMNNLYSLNLPDFKHKNDHPISQDKFFIITKHLIPEQFILYNYPFIPQRKELIFRYPGHLQKLQQYIEKCLKKLENRNEKKDIFINPVLLFLYQYFNAHPQEGRDQFLIVYESAYKTDKNIFKNDIEQFTIKNFFPYNYPKEHI